MKQEMLLCVPCAERMKQEGKRVEHTGNVRGNARERTDSKMPRQWSTAGAEEQVTGKLLES